MSDSDSMSISQGIVGRRWELVRLYVGEEEHLPGKGRFTLFLEPEGTARIRVDCNRAFGPYRIDREGISFGPIASTMAYCGDDSLDTDFMRLLEDSTSHLLTGEELVLISSEGRLVFSPE